MALTHPSTSLRKLRALRARERLILVFWGLARWLTLAMSVLLVVCFIDWVFDRYGSLTARDTVRSVATSFRKNFDSDFSVETENRMAIRWMNHFAETPNWLRYGCSGVLFATLLISAWYWLIRPWFSAPPLELLAVRAEKAYPEFDHRLVTAIQLTRRDAQIGGMSEQLIEIIAVESESLAGRHNLNRLANVKLLKKGALLLLVPAALLGLALLGFGADRFSALCQRQALANIPIPKKTSIKDTSPEIFVADGEVVLTFEVNGPIDERQTGTLIVLDRDGGCPEYLLEIADKSSKNRAIVSAKVRAPANFKYKAWFGDGRSAGWTEAKIEPRPQVSIASATMLMPGYVPLNDDGSRAEVPQRYGDLRLHPPSFIQVPLEPRGVFMGTQLTLRDPGSLARVRIHVQKPVTEVKLTLLSRTDSDERAFPLRTIVMDPAESETQPDGSQRYYYEATFAADFIPLDGLMGADIVADFAGNILDLSSLRKMQPNRYRVSAVDTYGFESRRDPHRSIVVERPDPPHVELLPERIPRYGKAVTEQDIIKDLPIPPGGRVVIMYACRSAIGFPDPTPGLGGRLNSPARLMVRVNEEPVPRIYLLDEIPQTDESGPFDFSRAEFENPNVMARLERLSNGVPFHARPAEAGKKLASRREAGGVYFFATEGLKKTAPDGTLKELEIGDSLEFWIEVTDRAGNRVTELNSPKRRKEIRSPEEVLRQLLEMQETESRLRSIEKRQQELGDAIIRTPMRKK